MPVEIGTAINPKPVKDDITEIVAKKINRFQNIRLGFS